MGGCYSTKEKEFVIFVLGAPGTGKTTQCKKLEKDFKWKNISIADSQNKKNIPKDKISLIRILQQELTETPTSITLIDGFPQNKEDLVEWNRLMAPNYNDKYVIYFYCSFELIKYRLMNENIDIEDINQEIVKYNTNTFPLITELEKQKQVIKVSSDYEIEKLYMILKQELEAHNLIVNNSKNLKKV